MTRFNRWENSEKGKGEDPVQIKKDLQECMQLNFSVFREGEAMAEGLKNLAKFASVLSMHALTTRVQTSIPNVLNA